MLIFPSISCEMEKRLRNSQEVMTKVSFTLGLGSIQNYKLKLECFQNEMDIRSNYMQ